MADSPGPQTVSILLKEDSILSKSDGAELVHIDIDVMLTFQQREVFNIICRYTRNNQSMRTYLIGVFLGFGAGSALAELRKKYPRIRIELSNISLDN